MKRFLPACVVLALHVVQPGRAVAAAPVAHTLCVFDPSGANGDAFNLAKDYRSAAAGWGVNFAMKPYTDERTAVEDFKAQKCDAVLLTGVRARAFNRFAATVEAIGSLPSYDDLERVIGHLAAPQAARLMQSGAYETVAVFPAGAVYLYLRSRAMTAVGDLAGQRIATIDIDEAARTMVSDVGASMVSADIGTFASMFNNGAVDACYAPAVAYAPLELQKGLGKKGGIVRLPLSQLTFQVLIRTQEFPAGFGQSSRSYAAAQFPTLLAMVRRAEQSIPASTWIDIPAGDQQSYEAMFQKVRVRLRDDGKVYDKTMLTLMRRVRCKTAPGRAECVENRE